MRKSAKIDKYSKMTISEKKAIIMEEKWIGYTRAEFALKEIENILESPIQSRPKNMLIFGPTNNGKSMILEEFKKRHPWQSIPDRENLYIPCLKMQAPPVPNERRFYNKLLDALHSPYRINGSVEYKMQKVELILRKTGTRILIIDELHHVLAGSARQQSGFLNVLKHLSNELSISIVAAGIEDAKNVINSDSQMENRFIPLELPRWSFNEDYLRLIATYESRLPFKEKSDLHLPEISQKILDMSEGLIGEINQIIVKLACAAAELEMDKIPYELIEDIDYAPPSVRRKLDYRY